MKKTAIFSREMFQVMENAMEIVDTYEIERATPIILFKGIMDLESNPLYDYLIANSYMESYDFEEYFQYAIADLLMEKQEKEQGNAEAEETAVTKEEVYCYKDSITNKTLFYTAEVAKIIMRTIEIASERKQDEITLCHLMSAIVEMIPKDILLFLRNIGINVKEFKKEFLKYNLEEKKIIPEQLKSFVKVLNDDCKKNERSSILGREKECEIVWQTMQKKKKRNVILIGKPGVGKSSIVKRITQDIVNENCPESFKNCIVLEVNVNASIAGTQYRGQAEERYQQLVDFLEKTENIILFIDEIHTILGAGACREGEMDLANALKPILAGEKVRVIGATTTEEYEKYFSVDGALTRRFRTVEVKEPTSKQVYPMLKNAIADLSQYHGVKITKSMVEYSILIASCFENQVSNPDRTIDLIDLAMVTAKTQGKKFVDKEAVLKNFAIEFKKFEKMDPKVKKSTAYHEAGHYIIGKLSPYLTDCEGIAVSIMPAENYLGITVFDSLEDTITISPSMEYYLDEIAFHLAGRVAEKKYSNSMNSGASSDLEVATKLAYNLVMKYGMMENFGKNRIYIDTNNFIMTSEKVVNNVNEEIDRIIAKAYARAEQILKENQEYLTKLVNQLMKKGILTKKELDKIFEKKCEERKVNS